MIANWGIRARVMFAAVLPMLVLAALMTALYTSLRITDLDQALTDRGRAFTRQLAAASEYSVFSGDREALQQLAATVMGEEDIVGVRIVGRDGDTLVHIGKIDGQLPTLTTVRQLQPLTVRHGRTLRLVEPIRATKLQLDDGLSTSALRSGTASGADSLGIVTVELSLDRLQRRRGELLWTGIVSVVFVLFGSLLLAGYMSRGVSGPIRRVADTALRLGQGRLHERVPPTGGGSLRKLAEGINEMAERLSEAHQDMARKIDEATLELRTRKEEAEHANLAKSRFLAAASHDLRQPMHALGLFIAELSQQPLEPRARGLVQHIAASAEAMENLLDSLLDISRLDAGVLAPMPQPFCVQPLLERLVTSQRPAAVDRGLRLILRPCASWVYSDPLLLERILANLVSNAIRYTPRGTILIACRRRGERLRIEVRDSGVGIPPDAQDIIFQEFVQLDNAERSRDKGLGLGLAIVRRLADLLGHGLELRSAPGAGSVFAIEAPLAQAGAAPEIHGEERPPGDLSGMRIALLDDDPLARFGTQSLLESWGCEVLATETPDDLLAALAPGDWHPALLISDFRLRGELNGIDLIRLLRSPDHLPSLPAILLSGDTGPETLASAQQAGIVLLHKPVRPARLRALIHRLLNAAD
ncbi:hybrid sensor histidine kinase/response regulator [Thauera sinica]|uniref:histidine kinase n=1 Tax=Thauera sinica TaxID=2665146 RepID=A0ABW1AV01_9RHOO|nr:ATP-binding protein [Thauera sp. K11]ATE61017.1 hybrid sensor histidine kinase/response regulator [Thauera sp. K11]